ncbi:legumain-like [Triplophysa dalaica]|uniref:legumain-like n=1 Tax=Triplophysa dalaica TaxID=1582913 RepID=UPI0024DFDEFA|nr:legumain-like [Triplophysa dalaica]
MSGKKWVLLVAGSKGWKNYKHQANVCCHYQLIKRQEIPDEQIVTMMYDDIADNHNNHHKQQILSVLGNENVYKGVLKDYTGKDVTPQNFLNVLQGNECTDKKVINSCKDDNIYIYMTGLGTENTFEFPEESLHASDFIAAIQNMTDKNKFSKMIIFVDSSYSANLFKNQLTDNEKVFVLTSCSRGTEITPTDYNKKRDVFLSDKFSSTWLHFLDQADYETQTFDDLSKDKQSKHIEENPNACPCFFGKLDATKHFLNEFLQK